jgi:predicted RNase H-like HicB family nuclease
MSTTEKEIAFEVKALHESWDEPANRYECRVILCPEDVGYSAHALNIAGVVSEGDTIDEALTNIADAFKATIEYHLEVNSAIPWRDGDPDFFAGMTNTKERWIAVDV